MTWIKASGRRRAQSVANFVHSGEIDMSGQELILLGGVPLAFVLFMVALGYVSWEWGRFRRSH